MAVWLNVNRLTLNLKKTKSMLIGSSRKLANIPSLSLSIFDSNVDSIDSFKYLGIILSSDFIWSEHVDHVITKVNQRLGLLRRVRRHLLPFQARLLFYNSLILPIFDYADIVWGDKNNIGIMNNLQILQNKAAKIILDRPLQSSATEALVILKWPNLEQRRFYHRCAFVYKCKNELTDHNMNLSRNSDVHHHNTRNNDLFRLPRVLRNWGKQRVCYHAVQDWNSLDKDTRNVASISGFKRRIYCNFLN